MADERTDEQRAADEALRAAVLRVHDAYFGASNDVLTQYLVLGVKQGWDEDDDEYSALFDITSRPAPPLFAQLGLVEHARLRLQVRSRVDRA